MIFKFLKNGWRILNNQSGQIIGVWTDPYIPDEMTDPPALSTSGELVSDKFENAAAYAREAWNTALVYLGNMEDQVYSIPWTAITIPTVDPGGIDGINPDEPGAISIVSMDIVLPTFSAEPPVMEDVVTNIGDPPDFVAAEPLLSIPDPPDVTWPIFDKDAPAVSDITIPTEPDIDLPAVPSLTDVVIPSPPDFQMPSFDGTAPVFTAEAPEPMFSWNEAMYDSDLLTALEEKLSADLASGSSGLDPTTEQAIYDRAIARQATKTEEMYDETLNYFSARGHSQPPGALNAALIMIRSIILQVEEDLNNDILVKQSDLAQKNTHFIISSGIAYEEKLMTYSNSLQQRAYDAAKYVVEYSVILYDIKVKAFAVQMEAYKAYAQVFESRIRAEIAKAEFYKAQIAGLKLNVDMQLVAVQLYVAQVDGIKTLIDLYTAQMRGAQIQAEVDKLRIDGYGAEVNAFAVKSQALVARYNAYQAQIAGETEKVKMYLAQAQAFEARIGGYKAKADVELSKVQIEVEKNKGEVSTFLALVEKYKSDITAAIAEGELIAKEQGMAVDVYKADTQQYAVELDAIVRAYIGKIEEVKFNVELQIKDAEIQVQALLAQYELSNRATEAGAKVSAQLAASAMSAVNASAHIGFGESRSDSRAYAMQRGVHSSSTRSHSWDETKDIKGRECREIHSYSGEDASGC